MEHPVKEIPSVITSLCTGSPKEQKETLETYFSEDAAFTHPLCRVPSFPARQIPFFGTVTSRWIVLMIYQWYKILSPEIKLDVKSVVFDQKTDTLYVSIFQIFSLWFVPFYDSRVDLVTVLKLSNINGRYIIKSQEDFYQTNQVVKFFWPLGTHIIYFFQLWATVMCVIGGYVFAPITWLLQSSSKKKEGKRVQIKAQ